jgi:hypothetical protein
MVDPDHGRVSALLAWVRQNALTGLSRRIPAAGARDRPERPVLLLKIHNLRQLLALAAGTSIIVSL